jgi:hypothetical protein
VKVIHNCDIQPSTASFMLVAKVGVEQEWRVGFAESRRSATRSGGILFDALPEIVVAVVGMGRIAQTPIPHSVKYCGAQVLELSLRIMRAR